MSESRTGVLSPLTQRCLRLVKATGTELAALFGGGLPAGRLLAAAETQPRRQRLWPAETTFWTFLAQCCRNNTSCREAVASRQATRQRGRPRFSGNTSGYCQARLRLPEAGLTTALTHTAAALATGSATAWNWHGLRVGVLDGTGLALADTVANQAVYPQSRSQRPGLGSPLLKVVGLFALATGACQAVATGDKHDAELTLAQRLWATIVDAFDLIIGDRAFCAWAYLAQLGQAGRHGVFRLHQMRKTDWRCGRKLGPNDRLVTWTKPGQCPPWLPPGEFHRLPASLTVRLVKGALNRPGFRTQHIAVATTLTDPRAYPVADLLALFRRRWEVELHFRELKATLGLNDLHGRTPAMVRRELLMHLVAYNLIRSLMVAVAQRQPIRPERLSFTGTLVIAREWAPQLAWAATAAPARYRVCLRDFVAALAAQVLPQRPDRYEPRAIKRRPKPYPLLTKPRMVARQQLLAESVAARKAGR
jgi:hypothetical protein